MFKQIVALLVLAIVAIAVAAPQERYPAGVSPASCPNYPFCNTNGYSGPPGYHFRSLGIDYPAGIHPSTCPNYPYC